MAAFQVITEAYPKNLVMSVMAIYQQLAELTRIECEWHHDSVPTT